MIINQNKITNPFLEMFICPNCHKHHEMGTKLCSYECSKEYEEKEKDKEINTLREVLSFLMGEAYRGEKKKKGWYETRRRVEFDENRNLKHVIGSGVCNTLANEVLEMLNRRLDNKKEK